MRNLFVSMLFVLAAGCGSLVEDRGDCPPAGVQLRFNYAFGDEDMGELAGDMRLWVFDDGGALVDVLRNVNNVQLPDGEHTIVAWASSCDNLENCYTAECSELDDFRLKVNDPAQFSDLYHAIVRGVRNGDHVDLDFTRYTSTVRVRVEGASLDACGLCALAGERSEPQREPPPPAATGAPVSDFVRDTIISKTDADALASPAPDIYIKGKKGTYLHDGFVCPDSPEHRYDHTDGNIHIQRLDLGFHAENPVTLYIERDGTALMEPLDLLQTILKNPKYKSQADLDREQVFDIEVQLMGELGVRITVNEYVLQEIDPILIGDK